MNLSKQAVLHRTHYGLQIYAYLLQLSYPKEIVISLSGIAAGPVKNPFNQNKRTLRIKIENGCAQHWDVENAIPPGNVFDFAKLVLPVSEADLLPYLANELSLFPAESYQAINTVQEPYPNTYGNQASWPRFSYFKSPIKNTTPCREVTIKQVAVLIRGKLLKERTGKLRAISDKTEARKFKASSFPYVTFSGLFTARSDKQLVKHSGLLTLDFDNISNPNELRNKVLKDEYLETELAFISPSGNGLKWIISVDINNHEHGYLYSTISNYIKSTYGVEIDKSGKDVSRACFISHDATAYVHPKYM